MTVGELMHRLAGLPPETQVRLPVDNRLLTVQSVHTIKLRARGVPFLVCVLTAGKHNVPLLAETTQALIDAAEAARKVQ